MRHRRMLEQAGRLCCTLLVLWTISLAGCKRSHAPPSAATPPPRTAGDVATAKPSTTAGEDVAFDVKGEPLGGGILVGAAKLYDNLTVFPILAKSQTDIGPLVSLHEALQTGDAEVRELGSAGSAGSTDGAGNLGPQTPRLDPARGRRGQSNPARLGNANSPGELPQQQQILQRPSGGAQVGKLAIQNKGKVPVYVLAGTIVKGGKQDRQIGQDFIIGAGKTVPIDAFCVEHGRWSGTRRGKTTGGKFEAVQQLAHRDVRVAGQYKKDQGEVWSKVSKVNAANKKHSESDSLLATADDAELKGERDGLARRILSDLDGVEPATSVVGYAYAVDGEVAGVRWFAHHRIFRMFREVLVNTAVADAMTARAHQAAQGGAEAAAPVHAKAVASFVKEAKQAPVAAAEERDTAADNVNLYQESGKAYRSTTVMKRRPAPGNPAPKKVPVSVDFAAKK